MEIVSKNVEINQPKVTLQNPSKVLFEVLIYAPESEKENVNNNFIKTMSKLLNEHPDNKMFRCLFYLYPENQTEQDAIGWLELNKNAYFTYQADANTEFTEELFNNIFSPIKAWVEVQNMLNKKTIKFHK